MKTLGILKNIWIVIACITCSTMASAISPKNYIYDTKEENGKVVSKVVYLEDQGILDKQIMYEFAYNESEKVTEKKAFRWNKKSNEWEPYFLISYIYESGSEEIQSTYGMWDKKKKDYSLNVQQLNFPLSSYEDIFS
ncbi:MAG: DUF3836 domain-containing protein [Tannerellaceae bacterium]|nr:DUF3836 domain-containing protein [Tannerellaceae bacterium]